MVTSNGRCEKVFFFSFSEEMFCFDLEISWDLENITRSYHLAKPSKNERKKTKLFIGIH